MVDSQTLLDKHESNFRWTILAFALFAALVSGLVIWQLAETSPNHWCGLAKAASPEISAACVTLLEKLLEIKDHVIIGLMCILGIIVIGTVAVALGLKITGSAPGGLSVGVTPEKATADTSEGLHVEVPIPQGKINDVPPRTP